MSEARFSKLLGLGVHGTNGSVARKREVRRSVSVAGYPTWTLGPLPLQVSRRQPACHLVACGAWRVVCTALSRLRCPVCVIISCSGAQLVLLSSMAPMRSRCWVVKQSAPCLKAAPGTDCAYLRRGLACHARHVVAASMDQCGICMTPGSNECAELDKLR